MSAWRVTVKHVNLLAQAYVAYVGLLDNEVPEHIQCQKMAEDLLSENYRSVNARYGERIRRPSFTYLPYLVKDNIKANSLFILKQINCYKYQSCEHDSWSKSKAFKQMTILAEAIRIEHGFTEEYWDFWEYNLLPWGV